MGIRDEEIKRLKKYAEGLGIKVYFKPHERGCGGADWDMEDQSIRVYLHSKMSKLKMILYFIHELGHHLDWIYNDKKEFPDAQRAYHKLCQGKMYGPRPDLTKEDRSAILREEQAGIHYMEYIYKELDLKFPYWIIKYAQAIDLYDYEFLYKHGRFPTTKELNKQKKILKRYYKKKYGRK